MDVLKREFSTSEKGLLIVLFVIIFGGLYYLFVDTPVKNGQAELSVKKEALSVEYDDLSAQLDGLQTMKGELQAVKDGSVKISKMPSYNAVKQELEFLNSTLSGAVDYYIGFTKVTREGDQIRRGFSLQYTAKDFDSARKIMAALEDSEIRCVVSDFNINAAEGGSLADSQVQVSVTSTFFETMHGGTPDSGLPEDKAAEAVVVEE